MRFLHAKNFLQKICRTCPDETQIISRQLSLLLFSLWNLLCFLSLYTFCDNLAIIKISLVVFFIMNVFISLYDLVFHASFILCIFQFMFCLLASVLMAYAYSSDQITGYYIETGYFLSSFFLICATIGYRLRTKYDHKEIR